MQKRIKSPVLVNAAQMRKEHPKSFGRPTPRVLKKVRPGDTVKVAIEFIRNGKLSGERFWVEVVNRNGDVFVGRVDNDLLRTNKLKFNDLITFHSDNIYSVFER